MLSTIVSRSTTLVAAAVARNPTYIFGEVFSKAMAARRSSSTLTMKRVDHTIEETEHVSNDIKHWTDVKDEVHTIKSLMHEGETNHAIDIPPDDLQQYVNEHLDEISKLMLNHPDAEHDEIFDIVNDMKMMVKDKLYPHEYAA